MPLNRPSGNMLPNGSISFPSGVQANDHSFVDGLVVLPARGLARGYQRRAQFMVRRADEFAELVRPISQFQFQLHFSIIIFIFIFFFIYIFFISFISFIS